MSLKRGKRAQKCVAPTPTCLLSLTLIRFRPQPFCLTICCLCYNSVNLHQFMVASQEVCPDPSLSCCLRKISRVATAIHTPSSCVRCPQPSEPPLLCLWGFGGQDSCSLVCSELCSADTAWDGCVPCLPEAGSAHV